MPYKDRERRLAYYRSYMAGQRAAERARRTAESRAASREMTEHPVANEWMDEAAVRAWAEFALSLPSLDEVCAGLTPLAELPLPQKPRRTHTRKRGVIRVKHHAEPD